MRAQVIPAAIQDQLMPLGPYNNVTHTGNYLAPCTTSPTGMFLAMCWDGTNPGMAFNDGNGTMIHNLPDGIKDPDIVAYCADQQAIIMVVYELSGNTEYLIYNMLLPMATPVLVNSGVLAKDSEHPNIDLNAQNNVAVVWSKPNSQGNSADIQYSVGDLQPNKVVWTASNKQADNKGLSTLMPQQNDYCYWPDIAISGGDQPGVHITFIEDDAGTLTWWKMDDNLKTSGFNFGPRWQAWFWQSGLNGQGADLTEPRIACSRSYFKRDWFEAVLTNTSTTGTHHVMGVNKLGTNTTVMLDWPMFSNGTCNNAVVAWADDPYINTAWSGEDPSVTVGYDIVVKRLDQMGQPYDATWAKANNGTAGNQLYPSIAGAGMGMGYVQEHFAYLWADDAGALWYKIVQASNQQLKKELPEPSGDATVNVFPNPTAEFVGIQLQEVLPNTSYVLSDYTGNVVATGTIQHHLHYINVATLPNGTYIIAVNQNGSVSENKIVVQH